MRQLVEHLVSAMNVRHSSTSSTAAIGAEVMVARQDPEGAALVFLVETTEHDDAVPPGQALVARVDRAVSVLVEVRPAGVPGIIGVWTPGGGKAWEEQHNTREVIDGALVVIFISMRVPCWAGKAGDSLRASVEYFDRGFMLTHGQNTPPMRVSYPPLSRPNMVLSY